MPFVPEGRSHAAFHDFATDRTAPGRDPAAIPDVCMDRSPAYQRGAAAVLPGAAVTFDRFHIMRLVGTALDDARRREPKHHPALRRSRYVWLTHASNRSARQRETLERLSTTNLLTAKASQMRVDRHALWDRRVPPPPARYRQRWCTWVTRATRPPQDPTQPWVLEARHRTAATLRDNAHGILHSFRRRLTSGAIESVNGLAQAARARARGDHNPETFKTIIYLLAGRPPFHLPLYATHSSSRGACK